MQKGSLRAHGMSDMQLHIAACCKDHGRVLFTQIFWLCLCLQKCIEIICSMFPFIIRHGSQKYTVYTVNFFKPAKNNAHWLMNASVRKIYIMTSNYSRTFL